MPFRRLGLSIGRTSAVADAGGLGYASFDEDGVEFGSKDFDAIRVHEILREFGLGIVVPAEDDQADIGFVQPARLGGEEASGVHRILFVVAEIAGQQRRIDPLVETKIDQTDEGLPDYRRQSAPRVSDGAAPGT